MCVCLCVCVCDYGIELSITHAPMSALPPSGGTLQSKK